MEELAWEKYGFDEVTLKQIEGAIISAPSLRSEAYWKKAQKFVIGMKGKKYSELTLRQRNWMFNISADLGKMENERTRNSNL
jgi:hypothetical protein